MFRKTILMTLALVMLAFAVGISPPRANAANSTWQYTSSGNGAEAYFTTCYDWPGPGTVCTDTGVYVGEFV